MECHNSNSIGEILMEGDEEPEVPVNSMYYSSGAPVHYLNSNQQNNNFVAENQSSSPVTTNIGPLINIIQNNNTAVFFSSDPAMNLQLGEETTEFIGQETTSNIQTSYPGTPITHSSTASSQQNSNFNSENHNRSSTDSPVSLESLSDSGDDDSTSAFFTPESVQAMAETVGVELNEEAAELVGQEAINKLRHLTLLALQFSRHCKSQGLRVVDVQKAEKILDSTSSLGHGMNYNPPNFVNLGGICGEHEGPEIDLLSTISDSSSSEITIDPNSEPILLSHFVYYHDPLVRDSQNTANESLEEYLNKNSNYNNKNDIDNVQSQCKRRKTDWCNPSKNINNSDSSTGNNSEKRNLENNEEQKQQPERILNNNLVNNNTEEHEDEEDDDDDENDDDDSSSSDEEEEEEIPDEEPSDESKELEHVPVEWAEYLQHFLVAFFERKKQYIETLELIPLEDNEYLEDDEILPKELDSFQVVLKDVAQYGVFPVLPIICDFFHDFINDNFSYKRTKQLKRITSFFDTTLACPIRCRIYYLKPMIDVLTQMVLLPVPCNVQPYVTKTLLKIADCSETPLNLDLLRWITQFIMSVLSSSSKLTSSQLTISIKTKICAAIHFAMGFDFRRLRLVKMQQWIEQVLMISSIHCSETQECSHDNKSNSKTPINPPDVTDSYLEEAILNFIGMYIRKYQSSVPDENLKNLFETAVNKYGEKLMMATSKSDLCPTSSFTLTRRSSRWKTQNPEQSQQNENKQVFNEFLMRSGWLRHDNKFHKVSIPFVLNVL